MPKRSVLPIRDLKGKIHQLKLWAGEVGREESSSLQGIARASGIKWSTFEGRLQAEDGLALIHQKMISEVFGFNIEWKEWRTGSCQEFINRFRLYQDRKQILTINPGLTTGFIDRILASFALGVAGSFNAEKEMNAIRLIVRLSFDPRGLIIDDGLTVALREVDLELTTEDTESEFVLNPLMDHNVFKADAKGTGKGHAYWTIKAKSADGMIFGVRAPNDGDDCILKGFREGDEIHAIMLARGLECFGVVAGKRIEESSGNKKKLIQHLAKKLVLSQDKNLFSQNIILAEQTIVVVEAAHD